MMDHPNIARVLDAGTVGEAEFAGSNLKSQIPAGRPYFVMELVRGIRITEYCDQAQCSTKERFSPDGQLLAICDWRGSNVVWDIAAGSVAQKFAGPREPVSAIRFSPDQELMATTSWDSDVRLWDAATGGERAVLKGHKATALNCIFTPDGRTLITGSNDGTIKFWNVATCRGPRRHRGNNLPE